MTHLSGSALGLLACLASAGTSTAQSLPTSQPKLLQIYREVVKAGHASAHEKTEAMWPAAYAKAKSPNYYLALSSMTGAPVVWFLNSWDSYTTWGKAMASDAANAVPTAELTRASEADAAHIDLQPTLETMARPDLGHGAYPDMSKQRFWEITMMRVKPGHEDQFAATAKAYKAFSSRARPTAAWRIYQVTAGMPGPTFLIFSSVESFSKFDALFAEGMTGDSQLTAEERALFTKFSSEDLIFSETNRFRLEPKMSYVSAETRAADQAFWAMR